MARVELTQGYFAEVDDEDLHLVSAYRWKVLKSGKTRYAARSVTWPGRKYTTVLMHRVIFGAADGTMVDHRDGDGLNNRRNNLREATYSQNGGNMKKRDGQKYRGIYWNKERQKWQAQIAAGDNKVKGLGRYDNQEDAARAYDKAAIERFGEFASLNFPKEKPDAG